MAVERARRRRHSRSSSTATSVQTNSTAGCYDELLEFLSYLGRLIRRRAARLVHGWRQRRRPQQSSAQPTGPRHVYSVSRSRRRRKTRHGQRRTPSGRRRGSGAAPCASPELSDIDLNASPRRHGQTRQTTSGELQSVIASTDLLSLPPTFPGSTRRHNYLLMTGNILPVTG